MEKQDTASPPTHLRRNLTFGTSCFFFFPQEMKFLTHEMNGQYWLFILQYKGREEWHSEAKETENNKENWQMKTEKASEYYRLTRDETAPTLATNKGQVTKDNTNITSQTKQRFWWQDHWYVMKKLSRRQTSNKRLESKRA